MSLEKIKILVDLLPALDGFAGIPQESRLLFKVLSQQAPSVEPGGLIYSNSTMSLKYNMQAKSEPRHADIIMAANFLGQLSQERTYGNEMPAANWGLLGKMLNKYESLKSLWTLLKTNNFAVKEIDSEHFSGWIWRNLFAKTLTPDDLALMLKQRYFISNLNSRSTRVLPLMKRSTTINTQGWDFVIFQFMRQVKVSPGTTKIVRYHDSIALQDTDVCIPNGTFLQGHDLKQSLKDSFYVCNSEPTREALLNLVPELEDKSATIALILANYQKSLNRNSLLSVIKRSFSSTLLSPDKQQVIYNQLKSKPDFPYILIVATIEPRKNYVTLIRAWEKLRMQSKINHRLVIVGNKGWHSQPIIDAMRQHVQEGEIIHLEKILPEDMGYIYSHADAFVFPSYNEGFGCPPLEAMQCECPVIVSDIKTHRWVFGDAALYCNPFDTNSLAEKLESLLAGSEADVLRKTLIARGLERIKLYSPEKIGAEWLNLLNKIKKNN